MIKIKKAIHPGRIFRDDYLEPLELSTGALANAWGLQDKPWQQL